MGVWSEQYSDEASLPRSQEALQSGRGAALATVPARLVSGISGSGSDSGTKGSEVVTGAGRGFVNVRGVMVLVMQVPVAVPVMFGISIMSCSVHAMAADQP